VKTTTILITFFIVAIIVIGIGSFLPWTIEPLMTLIVEVILAALITVLIHRRTIWPRSTSPFCGKRYLGCPVHGRCIGSDSDVCQVMDTESSTHPCGKPLVEMIGDIPISTLSENARTELGL